MFTESFPRGEEIQTVCEVNGLFLRWRDVLHAGINVKLLFMIDHVIQYSLLKEDVIKPHKNERRLQKMYFWQIGNYVLHTHHSTRSLRLSNTNLLCTPFVRTSFGSHSFSVAAPKIWNSLPPALRMCTGHDTFCHQLKTHYFQLAFQPT